MHVEHELGNGAMQAGKRPGHQRETRAGNLGRRGKIEQPKCFAQIDVISDREIVVARCPPTPHLDVVDFGFADRNTLLR